MKLQQTAANEPHCTNEVFLCLTACAAAFAVFLPNLSSPNSTTAVFILQRGKAQQQGAVLSGGVEKSGEKKGRNTRKMTEMADSRDLAAT